MAISAADKAKGAEALNRNPDLSPLARRLGIELLNRINRRTGTCWPSEARLALALNCNERSIRRAKVELRAAGLLSWECRGQHQTPVYALAWGVLKALGANITAKVRAAFTPAPAPSPAIASSAMPISAKISKPGRTFSSPYLTQLKGLVGGGRKDSGGGLQPFKPSQILSDQQLNAKAHSRLWQGLQRLAPQHLQTLIGQLSEPVEAAAVKAERFQPGTGMATLAGLLRHGVHP